jgi:hypothetical protein
MQYTVGQVGGASLLVHLGVGWLCVFGLTVSLLLGEKHSALIAVTASKMCSISAYFQRPFLLTLRISVLEDKFVGFRI